MGSANSNPAKVSTAHTVAGGQSNCPPDQAQDLTFTGGFVGHLTCQATPTFCYWNPLLADMSHWQSKAGQIVIISDDGKRVTGTLDGTLNGASQATVTGRWACIRQAT